MVQSLDNITISFLSFQSFLCHSRFFLVIPAKAGIHCSAGTALFADFIGELPVAQWIFALAGMTRKKSVETTRKRVEMTRENERILCRVVNL